VGSTVGFTVGLAVGTMLPTLHSIRTLPSCAVVGATLGAIVLFETLKVLLVNVMLLSKIALSSGIDGTLLMFFAPNWCSSGKIIFVITSPVSSAI